MFFSEAKVTFLARRDDVRHKAYLRFESCNCRLRNSANKGDKHYQYFS